MESTQAPAAPEAQRRWLLAVDGSPHADRCARYVARWAVLLGVVEIVMVNAQPIAGFRVYPRNRDRMVHEAANAAEEATRNARMMLDAAQVRHRLCTSHDDPAEAIVRIAREEAVDEIVLGARGLGPLRGMALGSVAYKVVHAAEGVVTVIPPGRPGAEEPPARSGREHRMLVGVDGSHASGRALRYVRGLAEHGNVELDVQLVYADDESRPLPPTEGTRPTDVGPGCLDAARELFAAAGIRHASHRIAAAPVEAIVGQSLALNCDRIVMGSAGVGALDYLTLGSVSYKVLHRSALPVTIVR